MANESRLTDEQYKKILADSARNEKIRPGDAGRDGLYFDKDGHRMASPYAVKDAAQKAIADREHGFAESKAINAERAAHEKAAEAARNRAILNDPVSRSAYSDGIDGYEGSLPNHKGQQGPHKSSGAKR